MCYIQMSKTMFDTEPFCLFWWICLEFNKQRQIVLFGDGDIIDKLFSLRQIL